MAAMFSTPMPRDFMREAAVRGPMPQSMKMAPAGARRTEQFPAEPLARIERERDIRVGNTWSIVKESLSRGSGLNRILGVRETSWCSAPTLALPRLTRGGEKLVCVYTAAT